MDITKAQKLEIRRLTRQAQRRMERASEGQRRVLEHQVLKATGSKKWSSAYKGFTYERAQLQIEKLQKFLAGKTTTITGWKEIKKAAVAKTVKTFSGMGYHLTDQEMAELLIQMKEKKMEDIYKAVNLVEAKKGRKLKAGLKKKGKDPADIETQLTAKEIATALNYKISDQRALQEALAAQQRIKVHYEKYQL